MKLKTKIRVGYWIALVFACMVFLSHYSVIDHHAVVNTPLSDRIIIPEIQDEPPQYDLSIENSGNNSGASSSNRFSPILAFPYLVVPVNFEFASTDIFSARLLPVKLVPIFIRGHAFLN